MKIITYPITLCQDQEDQSFINVTIPNILGAYTFGEGYDDAIYMAKDLLKLMVESSPEQCYPPESIDAIKRKWPDKDVENISIEVSDEVYRNYKEKMVPELENVTINVVFLIDEKTKATKIIFPDTDIEDDYADDPDEASEKAEMILKMVIKADISKIHAQIHSQRELRDRYPGSGVVGLVIPISKENKEKITSNFPLITNAIKSQEEMQITMAFTYSFFKHRQASFKALSRQLIRVYEEVSDRKIFIHLMEEVLSVFSNRLSEENLLELPIPFLLTLKQYDLAYQLLSFDKRDPLDPYIAFLKGVCLYYIGDFARSKYYLTLASKEERYKEKVNVYLIKVEKKISLA